MTGTTLETQDPPSTTTIDPNAPRSEETEQDDAPITTIKTADGKDVTDVSNVIHWRKQAKEAKREIATLKQQVRAFGSVQQELERAAPILNTLVEMPEAQRNALIESVRNGTAPSRASNQPDVQDDVEARELAEDLGLVDAGGALDVARGRRMLDRLDKRAEAKARTIVQPYAHSTAAMTASTLRERSKRMGSDDGTPYATAESVDETYAMLAGVPELAANPQVSGVLLGTAMLIDKMKGRVPKAPTFQTYGEPLLTEAPGGRRGAPVIDDATRQMLTRVGLTEKEFTEAAVPQRGMGRGTILE